MQVRIGMVSLDALPAADPRARRDNRARICWQLRDVEDKPLGAGLFVGPEHAAGYARANGWKPGGFPRGE